MGAVGGRVASLETLCICIIVGMLRMLRNLGGGDGRGERTPWSLAGGERGPISDFRRGPSCSAAHGTHSSNVGILQDTVTSPSQVRHAG